LHNWLFPNTFTSRSRQIRQVTYRVIDIDSLAEIAPKPLANASAEHAAVGTPVSKIIRITNFSPEEWETFVEEWIGSKSDYVKVRKLGGTGDMGLDVIGLTAEDGFASAWDNYQCKRFKTAIQPSHIWPEISKLIYYSFVHEYTVPRKYYFAAPLGAGTTVERLLSDHEKLKVKAKESWTRKISDEIDAPLEGALLDYFDSFDFRIFSSKSPAEMVREHAQTPFHTVRFGGGLPYRPEPEEPPETPSTNESRYLQQLFSAYSEHLGAQVSNSRELELSVKPQLKNDLARQRERFYHAEALRNFSRDTVPDGTFERLQDEVYNGVVEVCDADHADGLVRMREVVSHASQIQVQANPLASVVEVQDRQGICHQLANDDRLLWVHSQAEIKDE
jgi:hypothetical protein